MRHAAWRSSCVKKPFSGTQRSVTEQICDHKVPINSDRIAKRFSTRGNVLLQVASSVQKLAKARPESSTEIDMFGSGNGTRSTEKIHAVQSSLTTRDPGSIACRFSSNGMADGYAAHAACSSSIDNPRFDITGVRSSTVTARTQRRRSGKHLPIGD
jgi:hypothetical protein